MRKVKFLLVFVLLMAMLGAGQSMVMAQRPTPADAAHIEQQLKSLNPYLKINDDYTLSLDDKGAQAAGLSTETIQLGRELVKLNNDIVSLDKLSRPIDRRRFAKFEPFFLYVANEGFKGDVSILAGCGGGFTNPHPCPPWVTVGASWSSRQAVINYLVSIGYHHTAGYVGTDDYTKYVCYGGCCGGQMRSQAIIYQSGSNWGYRYQQPEPNPEVYDYSWPTPWWGAYVLWWHQYYC